MVVRRHRQVLLELADGSRHVLDGDSTLWPSQHAILGIVKHRDEPRRDPLIKTAGDGDA
jgi:hypothetical protein